MRTRLGLLIAIIAMLRTTVLAQTKVTIHVTGFCSFIHRSDAQPANEAMTLELMDGRKKQHPHVPVLIYPAKEQQQDPTDRPVYEAKNHGQRYFEFKGDSISFADAISSPLYYDTTGGSVCSDSTTFAFVPHLRDLAKEHAGDSPSLTLQQLDSRFYGPNASPTFIAAIIPVEFGKLDAIVSAGVIWDFKTTSWFSGSFHHQGIAQEVQWTFDVPGTTLTLQSKLIHSNASPADLVVLKAYGGVIDLTIANAIDSDIAILVEKPGNLDRRPEQVDKHFAEMYYDYIADWIGPRPRPVAMAACNSQNVPSTDECVLNSHVILHPPSIMCSTSSQALPSPETIGGLNCGPDQIP